MRCGADATRSWHHRLWRSSLIRIARISRRRYAETVAVAYDGSGAARYGGRWNSRDVRIAYASATLSLAALELRVHVSLATLANDYVAAYADIPDDAVIELSTLPDGWDAEYPPAAVQAIGDTFARDRTALALTVPSVLIPNEKNYLINPSHPDAKRIRFAAKLEPFVFALRLFEKR